MRVKSAFTALGLAICASPLAAQEQITPDAFLDLATGRTLTFTEQTSGSVVGIEQFLRRDLSVWAQANGQCSYGRIEVRGPLICFIYESFPNPNNCWMPFQENGTILVMSAESRQVQRVSDVSDASVQCHDAPLS